MLQLSAQVMNKRGYSFYTVNTTKEARLRIQESKMKIKKSSSTFSQMQLRTISDVEKGEDTIHVYKDGYKIEYFGVRDPETFVSWLMDVGFRPC